MRVTQFELAQSVATHFELHPKDWLGGIVTVAPNVLPVLRARGLDLLGLVIDARLHRASAALSEEQTGEAALFLEGAEIARATEERLAFVAGERPTLHVSEKIDPTHLQFDDAAFGLQKIADRVHHGAHAGTVEELCPRLNAKGGDA